MLLHTTTITVITITTTIKLHVHHHGLFPVEYRWTGEHSLPAIRRAHIDDGTTIITKHEKPSICLHGNEL